MKARYEDGNNNDPASSGAAQDVEEGSQRKRADAEWMDFAGVVEERSREGVREMDKKEKLKSLLLLFIEQTVKNPLSEFDSAQLAHVSRVLMDLCEEQNQEKKVFDQAGIKLSMEELGSLSAEIKMMHEVIEYEEKKQKRLLKIQMICLSGSIICAIVAMICQIV